MPQKTFDLSDLVDESVSFILPIKNENGEIEKKTFVIKDLSVDTVLAVQKADDDLSKIEGKDTKSIAYKKELIQRRIYEILSVDNQITFEQVQELPFRTLIKIQDYVQKEIDSIFLGDSPKSNTKEQSKSNEQKQESNPSQATA